VTYSEHGNVHLGSMNQVICCLADLLVASQGLWSVGLVSYNGSTIHPGSVR